jgi:hypothetical protein
METNRDAARNQVEHREVAKECLHGADGLVVLVGSRGEALLRVRADSLIIVDEHVGSELVAAALLHRDVSW